MKLIIAGSRALILNRLRPGYTYREQHADCDALMTRLIERYFPNITEVVCGMADRGGDVYAVNWARWHNVPLTAFPVTKQEWETIGRGAGHLRNERMAVYASTPDPTDGGLLALWDGESKGTLGMIHRARAHNLKTIVAQFHKNKYMGHRILEG